MLLMLDYKKAFVFHHGQVLIIKQKKVDSFDRYVQILQDGVLRRTFGTISAIRMFFSHGMLTG